METTGKVKDIARDWESDKLVISLIIDNAAWEEVERIRQQEMLNIKIVKYSEKRSLNANAYFHVLVGKIAGVLHSSNSEVKNRLIREYGAFQFIDDQIPTFKLKAVYEDAMLVREDIHVKPIGREYADGCEWVRFAFMRGSHTYNTQEMSRLIDGTVEEARDLGIETKTPDEIKRMVSTWNSIT